MPPWIGDWLSLLLRWFHFVVGAAWIGTSFYFVWLNNHIRPPEDGPAPPGVKGELWAVHGGAFYRVMKYAGAPEKLPKTLHWFKWEAYLTFLSGASLLALIYWSNAATWMVDASVAAISPWTAVGIGAATLVLGWLVYDGMCRSPLARAPKAFALVGFLLLTATAFALTHLLSARAAYLHMGALIGTIMAANVFFVIIPGQRQMVDAMIAGREPPLEPGVAGALRSLHNNYLTLPVLFIMVSHHYPMTFGSRWSWAVLAAIALVGAAVRHWFNLRGRGEANAWLLPLAAVGMVSLAVVSHAADAPPTAPEVGAVSTEEVQGIVAIRCLPCHSTHPSQPGFAEPPKGLVLETPAQLRAAADRIHAQAIAARIMPLGNLTGMTEEERAKLGQWLAGLQ